MPQRPPKRSPLQGDLFPDQLIDGLTLTERAAAARTAAGYHCLGHPPLEYLAGLVDRRSGRLAGAYAAPKLPAFPGMTPRGRGL